MRSLLAIRPEIEVGQIWRTVEMVGQRLTEVEDNQRLLEESWQELIARIENLSHKVRSLSENQIIENARCFKFIKKNEKNHDKLEEEVTDLELEIALRLLQLI